MENWPEKNGQLEKEFLLKDFMGAVDFVNQIAKIAEDADHHPDIFLHSYNKVRLNLMTHSEGRITQKDHDLASNIDKIFQQL